MQDLKNALRRLMALGAVFLPMKAEAADPAAVSSPEATPVGGPSQASPTAAATLPVLTVTGTSDRPAGALGGKYVGPLVYTPQRATVVDQKTMQDQGVTSMRDALRDVSGISLAAGENSQQGDSLTIDGFSINHDFFIDGLRDFGSYYRDPFDTAQVEVLKGPSGLLFGNGTTGGAVNQVSKQPQLDPVEQISLGFGSNGTRRATADVGQALPLLGDHTAFRLNVVTQQGGVAERNVAQNTIEGMAPSLEFGLGTPTRLTLGYFHLSENNIPDYGLPWVEGAPAAVPRQNFYGFADDYLRASVDLGSVKLEHDFGGGSQVADQLRYGNYSRNVRITEPQVSAATALSLTAGTLDPSNAVVTPNELAVYSTEATLDNLTSLTVKFDTFGAQHALQLGAEEVIESSNPVQTKYTGVPTQNLANPNENLNFTAATASVSSRVTAQVNTLAAYLLDSMEMGPYWQLIGGLRYDNVQSSFNNAVGSLAFSQSDNLLNWRAGLVFKPRHEASLYAVAGTSTDPSAENLALSAITTGQPPVKTSTYEVGTKWGLLDNKLSADAAVFWNQMDNALVENPANPATNIPAGSERARGFNAGLAGYVTPSWEVQAGYTYLDSQFLDYSTYNATTGLVSNFTGYPLRNAPQNTVNLWTSYDIGAYDTGQGFEIGAGMNYVSDRQAGKFAPNGAMESVPGYATYRAMLGYKLSADVGIQANLNNITDLNYIDQVHPGHLVPGEGRNLLVTTNLKF